MWLYRALLACVQRLAVDGRPEVRHCALRSLVTTLTVYGGGGSKEKEKADNKAAPKPKFVGNIEKLNPTQDKLLKKVAADMKVELAADAKTKLVEHLNALDNKDFNAKKLEEHIKEFLTPKVETVDVATWEIPYKGKNYCVNDKGEVFEENTLGNGEVVAKKVGNVGMAYFAEMEQPKDE